jgi:hypothetical protein
VSTKELIAVILAVAFGIALVICAIAHAVQMDREYDLKMIEKGYEWVPARTWRKGGVK